MSSRSSSGLSMKSNCARSSAHSEGNGESPALPLEESVGKAYCVDLYGQANI